MITKEEKLFLKIDKALRNANISKTKLAEKSGLTRTALSLQFRRLKEGGNMPLKTLFAIEELTDIKIFDL